MRILLVLIFLIHLSSLSAQKLKYRIEHIGSEEGLSQGSVYSIHKDYDGNMWFGTMDGLNFWDGKSMKVYRPSTNDIYSLEGIDVKKIIGYHNNDILIGTESCLNYFHSKTERFTKVYFRNLKGKITKSEVFPIAVSGDNLKLWLGGVGLLNYNFKTKRQEILFSELRYKTNYFSNTNTSHSVLDNDIWIYGDEGLLRYDLETKNISHFFSKNKSNIAGEYFEIVKVHIQKQYLWIATFDGFLRFNTKTLEIKKWSHFEGSKSIGHVFDITSDNNGNIWIGTEKNGLLFFDTITQRFEQISSKGVFSNFKLHNDEISYVYVDIDGNIWANTDPYGVDKIQILPGNFGTFRLNLESLLPESMRNFSIRSIIRDGDLLWIGTQQSGVWRVKVDDFSIIDGFYNLEKNQIPSNTIRYLHRDKYGTVWLGTSEGLAYFQNNKFVEVIGNSNLMKKKFIRVLEEFGDELWIGTEEGIYRINIKTKATINSNLLPFKRVSLIKFISKTRMLLGVYNEGLFEISSKDGFKNSNVLKLIDNCIPTSLAQLQDKFWIGTSKGLVCYQPNNGQVRWIRGVEGLPSEFIYNIETDKENQLWLSTNKGIVKFNPKNNQIHSFNINDGLQGFEFNGYSSFRDTLADKIYFGGVNGLNYFKPGDINVVGENNVNVLKEGMRMLMPRQISYFADGERQFLKPSPNDSIFNSKFRLYKSSIPNFSYTKKEVWLKFAFNNKVNKSWYFELGNSRFSELEVWLYEKNQLVMYKKFGDKVPFLKYDVKFPDPIFKMDMIENQDYVVYLKGSGSRDLKFPIRLLEESELLSQLTDNKLIWGIYLGFIILIAFYNIFLCLTIRDLTYLYYSLYILLFGAFQLSLYGFGFQYVWSNSWFNEVAFFVFLFLSYIYMILFTGSFLELIKFYGKTWSILSRLIIGYSLFWALISLFYFDYWFNYLAIGSGILYSSIFLLITIDYFIKKRVIIYYYGLATFFLVAASMLVGLQNLGFLEPFYQDKIIMIGSMLEIVLFSVALGYKFRQNQLEKVKQLILRNQISGNLHDDLAASLSSLTMYTELSKRKLGSSPDELNIYFDKISQKSRDILGKVREAVYELNPKNDTEVEWLERIVNFGKDIFESKNIEFRTSIPEMFDSLSLNVVYRREVYLIFKEAMNNAAKYSEAENVVFEVTKTSGFFEFKLWDNGKGINDERMNSGNGIGNMQERANRINGLLIINPKNGTEVILKVK